MTDEIPKKRQNIRTMAYIASTHRVVCWKCILDIPQI